MHSVILAQWCPPRGACGFDRVGKNIFGQLGVGDTAKKDIPTAVTIPAGVSGWVAVAAGFGHTCAIAAGTDAAMYCFGAWRERG